LGIKLTQLQRGYALWVQLPEKIASLDLYKFAKEQGINIVPGEVFGEDKRYSNFIRISAGYPLNNYISKALITLKE